MIYKSTMDEFSSASPSSRIKNFKWWFMLLVLIGILALIFVWNSQGDKAIEDFQRFNTTPEILTIVMAGVFLLLGVIYIMSIAIIFFVNKPNRVETAIDIVKTLTGFFIGVATSFIEK